MGTRLIVGFESALSFWRSSRVARLATGGVLLEEARSIYGVGSRTLAERARVALGDCGCDGPLDVVLPPGGVRHSCPLIRDHRWNGPPVDEGLFKIDEQIYVYRMPAVLVQLACTWDEIDIATVAMEMLGRRRRRSGFAAQSVRGKRLSLLFQDQTRRERRRLLYTSAIRGGAVVPSSGATS